MATGILRGRRFCMTLMACLVGLANDLYEIRGTIEHLPARGGRQGSCSLDRAGRRRRRRNAISMVNQRNAWKTTAIGLNSLYGRPERTFFMRGAFAWILFIA